jgi:hypothetical protein
LTLLNELHALQSSGSNVMQKAAFVLVYLSEAHASDTWPLGAEVSVCTQSRVLQDRQDYLKLLQQAVDFDLESLFQVIVVDDMKDTFLDTYSAWPLRYYVVSNNVMKLVAQPGHDHTYSVDALINYFDGVK